MKTIVVWTNDKAIHSLNISGDSDWCVGDCADGVHLFVDHSKGRSFFNMNNVVCYFFA
jgi:hypothetical protein